MTTESAHESRKRKENIQSEKYTFIITKVIVFHNLLKN